MALPCLENVVLLHTPSGSYNLSASSSAIIHRPCKGGDGIQISHLELRALLSQVLRLVTGYVVSVLTGICDTRGCHTLRVIATVLAHSLN